MTDRPTDKRTDRPGHMDVKLSISPGDIAMRRTMTHAWWDRQTDGPSMRVRMYGGYRDSTASKKTTHEVVINEDGRTR